MEQSKIKDQISAMNMDQLVHFINITRDDIAHLDITRDDYWEAKSNLQQNIIWALERFHTLHVDQILAINK
jgi:hypothetical protein